MSSEWMKVMLDEIARKKTEAEQEQLEQERRSVERAPEPPGAPTPGEAPRSRRVRHP